LTALDWRHCRQLLRREDCVAIQGALNRGGECRVRTTRLGDCGLERLPIRRKVVAHGPRKQVLHAPVAGNRLVFLFSLPQVRLHRRELLLHLSDLLNELRDRTHVDYGPLGVGGRRNQSTEHQNENDRECLLHKSSVV
jgi:hypothetical protein